jgi:hypothetical protein
MDLPDRIWATIALLVVLGALYIAPPWLWALPGAVVLFIIWIP